MLSNIPMIPPGLDSLLVCLGLGAGVAHLETQRWRTAACFGVCDGIALLLGSICRDALQGATGYQCTIGLLSLFAAIVLIFSRLRVATSVSRLVILLAAVFSADDFLYGVQHLDLPAQALEMSAFLAIKSACLAFAGLWLGSTIVRKLSDDTLHAG